MSAICSKYYYYSDSMKHGELVGVKFASNFHQNQVGYFLAKLTVVHLQSTE